MSVTDKDGAKMPESLYLCNRMRRVSLPEFRDSLERLERRQPELYIVVKHFLLGLPANPPDEN